MNGLLHFVRANSLGLIMDIESYTYRHYQEFGLGFELGPQACAGPSGTIKSSPQSPLNPIQDRRIFQLENNQDARSVFAHFVKIQREMKDAIEKLRARASDRHAQTLSPVDALKAAEMRGAFWALEEEDKRMRSALGMRVEWLERLNPVDDLVPPGRIEPGRIEEVNTSVRRRGRGAA